MLDPQVFFDQLQGPKYKYKLKRVGASSYHLGRGFSRHSDGTYIWELRPMSCVSLQTTSFCRPKERSPHAEYGEHPEVDTSEFLDSSGIRQYMSLLGAL
jgi:hypothetical protein